MSFYRLDLGVYPYIVAHRQKCGVSAALYLINYTKRFAKKFIFAIPKKNTLTTPHV